MTVPVSGLAASIRAAAGTYSPPLITVSGLRLAKISFVFTIRARCSGGIGANGVCLIVDQCLHSHKECSLSCFTNRK